MAKGLTGAEAPMTLEGWYEAIPRGEKKHELMRLARETGRAYTTCLWWVRGMSAPADAETWEAVTRVTGVPAPQAKGGGHGCG